MGPWTASPVDLTAVPTSRYLRLELRLFSEDRETTPIVHAYQLKWTCP